MAARRDARPLWTHYTVRCAQSCDGRPRVRRFEVGALIDDEFPDGEGFYYMARALARVGELELATDAFDRATRSFLCVPGMDRDRWIDPLRGRADFEAALETARERHLRTVAQFESAGGRCLIDG